MIRGQGRRWGLTTKLVVPFVLILVTALATVTVLFTRSVQRAVVEALQTRPASHPGGISMPRSPGRRAARP